KPSSIQEVDLSCNNIGDPLPDSIFDLVNLTSLDLSSNNLSGVRKVVPEFCSNLEVLGFRSVEHGLQCNNTPRSRPAAAADQNSVKARSSLLFNLYYFVFQVTKTDGSSYKFRAYALSVSFGCLLLPFIQQDLSNNMISGGISKWKAEGWEGLQLLDLFHNFLATLEQFPGNKLEYLNLHSNLLQGPIVSTCLNKELSAIIISKNKLTGNIPSSICKLSSLSILDLSKNNFCGTIPDCLGNFNYL
ncbi:hypothetical protein Gotri_012028, partial [Gossypium trilobum]|nr:hypothetical protein [Gossypium trilobum]